MERESRGGGQNTGRPTRVRLPDIIVNHARRWPAIFTIPPMIVIEILSPSDSMIELEQKCDEYTAMGIPNVWVINPEK